MIEAVKNAREASTDSIISHEGFLKTISTRDHIEWLAEKFGRTNVKVILYLRRIDQWVEASISQRSKGVEPYSDEMVRRAARNRLESYEKIEQNLEVWEEIFGSQSIVVRPFERKSFVGGDVISDFAHALDLPELSRLFEQKRKNFRTRNLSPNVESVRLWPQFLSYPVSKRTELEKKIVYLLSSQQLLERLGPPRASFLSFEARTSLVQRVSGMYGRLAEKYLGQEKFFVDEGPQEGDFPEFTPADEKRTFEIMYDFLVESFRAEGIDAKVLLSERMKSGISDTKPERPLAT
ncbi:hypothetical protein RUE5091_00595 [Ruegeria denitrificans]|uniref:Sulfotransferase domain-containing protein n=2 Tax=Ruegeria denitrificans TaxID=1715692 RepID=A0A0P1I3E2_9RHOB|nr:hypothetical protein RUE5091_00595 [Ruegeria denitrificans]